MFEQIKKCDPQIYQSVVAELRRQQEEIELIASENFAPLAVMEAAGSPQLPPTSVCCWSERNCGATE